MMQIDLDHDWSIMLYLSLRVVPRTRITVEEGKDEKSSYPWKFSRDEACDYLKRAIFNQIITPVYILALLSRDESSGCLS